MCGFDLCRSVHVILTFVLLCSIVVQIKLANAKKKSEYNTQFVNESLFTLTLTNIAVKSELKQSFLNTIYQTCLFDSPHQPSINHSFILFQNSHTGFNVHRLTIDHPFTSDTDIPIEDAKVYYVRNGFTMAGKQILFSNYDYMASNLSDPNIQKLLNLFPQIIFSVPISETQFIYGYMPTGTNEMKILITLQNLRVQNQFTTEFYECEIEICQILIETPYAFIVSDTHVSSNVQISHNRYLLLTTSSLVMMEVSFHGDILSRRVLYDTRLALDFKWKIISPMIFEYILHPDQFQNLFLYKVIAFNDENDDFIMFQITSSTLHSIYNSGLKLSFNMKLPVEKDILLGCPPNICHTFHVDVVIYEHLAQDHPYKGLYMFRGFFYWLVPSGQSDSSLFAMPTVEHLYQSVFGKLDFVLVFRERDKCTVIYIYNQQGTFVNCLSSQQKQIENKVVSRDLPFEFQYADSIFNVGSFVYIFTSDYIYVRNMKHAQNKVLFLQESFLKKQVTMVPFPLENSFVFKNHIYFYYRGHGMQLDLQDYLDPVVEIVQARPAGYFGNTFFNCNTTQPELEMVYLKYYMNTERGSEWKRVATLKREPLFNVPVTHLFIWTSLIYSVLALILLLVRRKYVK